MLTNTEKVLSVLMLFLVVSVAGSFFQTKSAMEEMVRLEADHKELSLINISAPTRKRQNSYAV